MQMVEIRPSLFLPLYVKSVAKLGLTPCRVPGQAIERFVSSEQMTQSHLSLKGSNQMYSQRTWLLWPRLSLGLGDESDASKLRHGCKTVMINETSCLESTPVSNEEEAPVLIGEQGVDRTSGYPACLSTNAAVDTSNETSNTKTTTSTAPRITASTRPTSPGVAQAGSWRRSPGPAPRQKNGGVSCLLLSSLVIA